MCKRAAEISKAFQLPDSKALFDNSTATLIACLCTVYFFVAFFLFTVVSESSWIKSSILKFILVNALALTVIIGCPVAAATLSRHRQLYGSSNTSKVKRVRYKTMGTFLLIFLLFIGAVADVWPLTMYALRTRNTSLARWFIEHKINIDSADAYGTTPLRFACRQKDTQLVRLLLDQGASVNKWDAHIIWKAPLAACSSSNLEIVRMLLQHGANANVSDDYGTSILMSSHFSIDKTKENEDIFMLLISHGANMNAKDREGSTVVMHLVHQGNFSLAAKLVEMGAILTNNERITSCFSKLRNWRQGDQPQAWLEFCKMDVNQRDENGSTPLLHSVRTFNLELMEELLKQGADPSIKDITGKSVYQYIDMMAEPEKVRLLPLLKKYEAKQ